MNKRFLMFTVDVWRFAPVSAVTIALLVNLVNLRHVLDGQLTAEAGLSRFAIAFVLALIAVGSISRMLTSYARHVLRSHPDADNDESPPAGGRR